MDLRLNLFTEGVCISVPYIKLLPEELVVISHATVHFFLQLVNGKRWVLPVCAGGTGQKWDALEFCASEQEGRRQERREGIGGVRQVEIKTEMGVGT